MEDGVDAGHRSLEVPLVDEAAPLDLDAQALEMIGPARLACEGAHGGPPLDQRVDEVAAEAARRTGDQGALRGSHGRLPPNLAVSFFTRIHSPSSLPSIRWPSHCSE